MRMIFSVILVSFVSIAALGADVIPASQSKAPHTRVTYPSVVSVEVLGRGVMYSINFDQAVSDELAAGFGYGSVSTDLRGTSIESGQSAKMIPAYMNYYFSRTAGSIYGTLGVNVVMNAKKVKGTDSATGGLEFGRESIVPTFGVGYENRGDTGFLFRFAAYGLVADNVAPWLGFSFGYAF
jgi:hypothetical protein